MIHENLVKFDAKLNLVPGLAEKWEQASDGMSWTFFLRKGVKFHTARHSMRGRQVLLRPHDRSGEALPRRAPTAPLVESATVVDEYTVQSST